MSVFHLKRLSHPEVLRSISPRSLLALLRKHKRFLADQGLALPKTARAHALDFQKLIRVLNTPDIPVPGALVDALFYINEMATPEAMDALLAELDPAPRLLKMFGDEPADVAVRAWLKDPELVARKYAEIQASKPRQFQYFQSQVDPPEQLPELTGRTLSPLERYLDVEYERRSRGRGARVLAFPHADDCLFMIRHGDPRRREGALDGLEETSVMYRPLKFDIVGYEAPTGTLRVYARTKWETSLLRGAFGKYVFGAIDHFSSTGRYTLDPLRSADPKCLICSDVPRIKLVHLTEVQVDRGGIYHAIEIYRATDVLADLQKRQLSVLNEPRIIQASFEVFLFGESLPRKVTIIPPNVARYSRDEDSRIIDRWLTLRGFIKGKRTVSDEQQGSLKLLCIG